MPARFPLFAKIAVWFLLNLLLLALVGAFVAAQQGAFGLDSLLAGRAGERVRSVAGLVFQELNEQPQEKWNAILGKFEAAYPVRFVLFDEKADQLAGAALSLPDSVRERVLRPGPPGEFGGGPRQGGPPGPGRRGEPPQPGGGGGRPPGPGAGRPPMERPPWEDPEELGGPGRGGGPDGRLEDRPGVPPRRLTVTDMVRAGDPARYWVLARAPLARPAREGPATLLLVSESLSAGGLIFDPMPLLWAVAAAALLSVLFWLPLIGGITRQIKSMRDAAMQIAEGRFEGRVDARRRDELGALGAAINTMSERLAGLLNGQRRFLSDVAHELCAPLSRLQMALGVLEQRAAAAGEADETVADVREEVDHMAALVNELLSFSKAAASRQQPKLSPLELRPLMEAVAHREEVPGTQVVLECAGPLWVQADAALLERALGNLLRNALHYAGAAGPVTVSAAPDGEAVLLSVSDQGPGVPEAFLPQLFDPFFRADPSRTRETGGVGLGMTIARTCAEACGGTISARNRRPSGLQVEIRLARAGAVGTT